ncbi:MAG: excinuclease ABC subunit UvrA [Bacteroidales bacterium]|nr:excinuclease ABC subunit UvrA [Bacteroidales bacterium]
MAEQEYIEILNAYEHNLKNVSLKIPRDKFVVVTGLSGSGKSSLAFDTLYAEGQRRYVESLSAYARQFLGRIKKPAVEHIKGLPPAIAIEQKVRSNNSRSTVGTATEIYDYLKLLFARVGKTYSPVSNIIVEKHYISDVVKFAISQPNGAKILILSPINLEEKTLTEQLNLLTGQGFLRVEIKIGEETQTIKIQDLKEDLDIQAKVESMCLVIDRIKASDDSDSESRVADSVQTAFFEGGGYCRIKVETDDNTIIEEFSNRFEADGIEFEEPSVNMFNFNNPIGACKVCNGFGTTIGIDEKLVIPDEKLSVFEETVACWKGEKLQYYKNMFIKYAAKYDFPIHKPYADLTEKQKDLLWDGNHEITGIHDFFKLLESEQHKIQNRVLLSRYRGKTICHTCKGGRLKKNANYVKIDSKSITDLVLMQIKDLKTFFDNIKLDEHDTKISKRLLTEIQQRVDFMVNVGLGYLALNRPSTTLSGGETQRINIATALGSSLVGSLYVLDEPTIGLHARDTEKLVNVLVNLQKLGNTLLVVEHEEKVIEQAEWIVDLGPLAGAKGGEIVFEGTVKDIKLADTLTGMYMSGRKQIEIPKVRRKPSAHKGFLEIIEAKQNNLKNISTKIPLGIITAVTGVSGSGKSSLIKDVLYPSVLRHFEIYSHALGRVREIKGDFNKLTSVEFVDQNPIGRSSRSNPATYIKAYDDIRKLFSSQKYAKVNGLTPGHFSFNTDGGRCEECQGDGYITVEMQFMADVTMVCESCNGMRFQEEVLDVKFKEKNIYDVLEMTIDEAIEFFTDETNVGKNDASTLKNIVKRLEILSKVGLGYVKLGQPSSTLSGGESQRIKLATFIANESASKPTLFIFDEPTTGLHFDDVRRLLAAFNELCNKGHTVVFIEHNLEMIKSADWVIDLGPEGGNEGGNLIFEGTPEELVKNKKSYTGKYLKL